MSQNRKQNFIDRFDLKRLSTYRLCLFVSALVLFLGLPIYILAQRYNFDPSEYMTREQEQDYYRTLFDENSDWQKEMNTIQTEEEELYKIWNLNKDIYEKEVENINDPDFSIILRSFVVVTNDYKSALNFINSYIKFSEKAPQLVNELKAKVFNAIKDKPLEAYIENIENATVRKKANELFELFIKLEDDIIATDGWRFHRNDWQNLESDFEKVLMTKGLVEFKIREMEKIRQQLIVLYKFRICHINYLNFTTICTDNNLNLFIVTKSESEKKKLFLKKYLETKEKTVKWTPMSRHKIRKTCLIKPLFYMPFQV
jgi:hypothetical protein